jgi:diaminopimelate decarboxylase
MHQDHGLELRQIDLGGGLGVPYGPDQSPLDAALLGEGLAALLQAHAWFTGELILEPGRFLAAPCGVYLARVIRVKESRGTRFAILEGGINHLLRPLLTGEPFPVKAVDKAGPTARITLAGPLCTSLDRLGEVDLPEGLAPGDLLAFGMTGAYGLSEGMTHFLSHPVPPEVWVDGSALQAPS